MKRKSVLYLEVAEKMKTAILNGEYPVGTLLPTETELEELFEVSKITVRRAIELLAEEELVEKKSGRGTTVLSNRPYNKLSKATTFSDILNKSGQTIEKKVLSVELIKLSSNTELYMYFGEKATKFSRQYHLDGKPYIYFDYYLPQELASLPKSVFEKESLYRILNQQNIEIVSFQDSFKAVELTKEQQELLATKEKLGLKRTRKSIDFSGKVVEFSRAFYNTEIHPYLIDYQT